MTAQRLNERGKFPSKMDPPPPHQREQRDKDVGLNKLRHIIKFGTFIKHGSEILEEREDVRPEGDRVR